MQVRSAQGRQSAGAVEHSDGEGAEHVGQAVGATGRRSASAAPRGGGAVYGGERRPCAGRGRIQARALPRRQAKGEHALVYMMVKR